MLEWLDKFPWENERHKKAYLGMLQWLREKGESCMVTNPIAAFFVLKDQESHDYWLDLVGTQVNDLRMQIKALQMENQELRQLILQVQRGRIRD